MIEAATFYKQRLEQRAPEVTSELRNEFFDTMIESLKAGKVLHGAAARGAAVHAASSERRPAKQSLGA